MSIVVKNNTGSVVRIDDIGVIIPGSGQDSFTASSDFRAFRDSDDTRTLVLAGTLTLNDGVNDIPSSLVDSFLDNIFPTGFRNNFLALTNPGTSNDLSEGYQKGSSWVNELTQESFVCLDASSGAAVWQPFSGSASAVQLGIVRINAAGTEVTKHATIVEAMAAASSGDIVVLGVGTYSESFTIPANVTLLGQYGQEKTVIAGAASTGTRITLSDETELVNLDVLCPTDATPAIVLSSGTARTQDVTLVGQGTTGSGVLCSGGTLRCIETITENGNMASVFSVTSGSLSLFNTRILGTGTITDAIVGNGGTLIVNDAYIDNSGVVDTFSLGATTAIFQNITVVNADIGFHVTSNSLSLVASAVNFNGLTTNSILVDPGLTTANFLVTQGRMPENLISAPGAWLASEGVDLQFFDASSEDDEGLKIWGELSVGHAEEGHESVFGEGDSYTRGMVVLTTDNTASSSSDGGNFTDVSTAARSASGSTFSFQGVTANHTILIGSSLENATDFLKHWGIKNKQTTAAVEVTPKSFVFEIWNGSAWTEIAVMATNSSLYYRYGNALFIRSNISEHIRYGVTLSTPWVSKTINGQEAYWSRIRITTTVTTAPVFQQFKLSTNRSEINADGTHTFHGSSRFRRTLFGSGNIWGEKGLSDFTVNIGSGGSPTGWSHQISRSSMANNDELFFQFPLAQSIDTSQPFFVLVYYTSPDTEADFSMTVSFKQVEAEGVLIADPSGGTVPTPRTLANTTAFNTSAAQFQTVTGLSLANDNKARSENFGPFSIEDLYPGDLIFIRLNVTDLGGGVVCNIIAIELDGVSWTLGATL